MTCKALQSISELPLEVVHNKTVVPRLPRSPLSFTSNLGRQPIQLCFFFGRWCVRRFDNDPVQILVNPIYEKTEKFLGIVLI